jgi:hypothetical protein
MKRKIEKHKKFFFFFFFFFFFSTPRPNEHYYRNCCRCNAIRTASSVRTRAYQPHTTTAEIRTLRPSSATRIRRRTRCCCLHFAVSHTAAASKQARLSCRPTDDVSTCLSPAPYPLLLCIEKSQYTPPRRSVRTTRAAEIVTVCHSKQHPFDCRLSWRHPPIHYGHSVTRTPWPA